MAALLPPDLENAIVIRYENGKGVVSAMPSEESGTEHDYYLLCHATAVCLACAVWASHVSECATLKCLPVPFAGNRA